MSDVKRTTVKPPPEPYGTSKRRDADDKQANAKEKGAAAETKSTEKGGSK